MLPAGGEGGLVQLGRRPSVLRTGLVRIFAFVLLAAGLSGCGYGVSLDAFSAAAVTDRNSTALPGRVYLFRGLIGDIFSLGMDELAEKIRRQGVMASVHGVSAARWVADDIIAKYRSDAAPIVLIGHSTGGDAIIALAQQLKRANVPVALAFGFDPTPVSGRIPSNVEIFINLYQATNLIGGGTAVAEQGFRGRLINVDLRDRREIIHITLDKSDAIHDLVLKKIIGVAEVAAARRDEKNTPPPAPARNAKLQSKPAPPPAPEYVIPLVMRYVVPSRERIELWDSAITVTADAGDTLETIAARNTAPVWAIAQINKLDRDASIAPGQKLLIPRNVVGPGAFSAMAAQIR